nr:uncharacterized protein LOC128685839 [Cherax quadricarinatus]
MQDKREKDRKLNRASRVYPSRSRRAASSIESSVEQDRCVSEYGGSCVRAATPCNIDLPSCNVNSKDTTISQSFFSDSLSSALKVSLVEVHRTDADILANFTSRVMNTDLNTVTNQTLALSQNPKAVLNAEHKFSKSSATQACKKSLCDKLKKENLIRNVKKCRLKSLKWDEAESPEKLKRPQHQIVGFLEDHVEFTSEWTEASDARRRYTPSVLESTLDGSIVKGARRLYGSRARHNEVNFFINTANENTSCDQDPLITLDEWKLKSEQHKYKCSKCETWSRCRRDIEQHIAASLNDHCDAVVMVLLGNQAQGRSCPVCDVRLQRTDFFQHIHECHKSSFPLRCGYCVFLGQDHNQLRHHIRNKHGTSEYRIIDIPRLLAEHDLTDNCSLLDEDDVGSGEDDSMFVAPEARRMCCPLCGKTLKTLPNLKKHVVQHSRHKQRCKLCSFTTSLPAQITSHYHRMHPSKPPRWNTVLIKEKSTDTLVDDVAPFLKLITAKYGLRQPKKEGKWKRQYKCPHCDYACNFNSSFNRHLRLHDGVMPYKCGHCNFHARESYLVRKHCSKFHKGKKIIIENDSNFKVPYRYEVRAKKVTSGGLDDERKDEGNPIATDQSFLPVQSRTKPKNESTSSEAEARCKTYDDSEFKKRDNEPLIGSGLPSIALRTKSRVSSDPGKQLPLSENKRTKEKKIKMSSINSSKSQPRKKLKFADELQKVSVHEPECSTTHVAALNTNEKNSLQHTDEAIEIHKSEQVSNKSVKGKLRENKSLSSMWTTCSEDNYNQDISRGRKQVLNQTDLPQACLPIIKVKTFKLRKKPQPDSTKLSNRRNFSRLGTCDQKELILQQHNNKLLSKRILKTSTHSDTEECCNIKLSVPKISDESEKAVVLHVSDADNKNLCLEKISSCGKLEESLSVSYKYCDNKKQGINLSLKSGNPGDCMRRNNDAVVEAECTRGSNTSVRDTVLQKIPQADHQGNQESVKAEPLTTPLEGLEDNLYTHIAFLTDSRIQCLSNRISATPGVMTRDLLGLDYSNSDYFSSHKVRLMMKKKKGGKVKCQECGVVTTYRAFYKHAKKHFNIKPFKCGYCSYRSIEKSKIRVHSTFCHPNSPCVILKLSPEIAGVNGSAGHVSNNKSLTKNAEDDSKQSSSLVSSSEILSNTVNNSLESTVNFSALSSNSRAEELTSSIKAAATSVHNVSSPTESAPSTVISTSQRQPSFQCPICLKFLQKHTPSIRRHLYSHFGYKPYKCGYCSFTGIGQSEVRAHHVTHGFTTLPKVEPSGTPVPPGLMPYIDNVLTHQRTARPSCKKRGQISQQSSEAQLQQSSKAGTDRLWAVSKTVSKEDITAIYLTPHELSQQGVVCSSEHSEQESLNVDTLPLPHPLVSQDLTSKGGRAVQVLESSHNAVVPSTLPPQLDLRIVTDTHSNFSSKPVCVLYLG